MTPVETLTAAVALYEQRREGVTEGPWEWWMIGSFLKRADVDHTASWSPSVTDPVVQAWRVLRDSLHRRGITAHIKPIEAAVLASATAYLAGAA